MGSTPLYLLVSKSPAQSGEAFAWSRVRESKRTANLVALVLFGFVAKIVAEFFLFLELVAAEWARIVTFINRSINIICPKNLVTKARTIVLVI